MNSPIPTSQLITVCAALLIIGTLVCLPLYKWNIKKLSKSPIFIKIIFWIPILTAFLLYMYLPTVGKIIILGLLCLGGLREYIIKTKNTRRSLAQLLYVALVFSGFLSIYLLSTKMGIDQISLLVTLCIGSVMSDVFAFFFGNFIGKHKLPKILNNHKSYEGILGQLIGALIGVIIVNWFIVSVPSMWLFLPIGIGSAVGDLYNSYIKRQLSVKDWGKTIPGHGGVLDRFASLSIAALLTYASVLIFI